MQFFQREGDPLGLSGKGQSLAVCPDQAVNSVQKTGEQETAFCPESDSQRAFQARLGSWEEEFGSHSAFSFQSVTHAIFSKPSIA